MTLLEEILQKVEKSELDDQLKEICDKIMAEERPKFNNPEYEPRGPNVFLSVQCNKYGDPIGFLTLEREMKEKYFIALMTKTSKKEKDQLLVRKKVWDVKEFKAEKILKFFAETLKFVKGN